MDDDLFLRDFMRYLMTCKIEEAQIMQCLFDMASKMGYDHKTILKTALDIKNGTNSQT